jgi:hypothetical protein
MDEDPASTLALENIDIEENRIHSDLQSPDRPTKDTEVAASNLSSVYSYDS